MIDLLLEKCKEYGTHFSELLEMDCHIVDIEQNGDAKSKATRSDDMTFCRHCLHAGDNMVACHLYGCHEAQRWNGRYIYYCPIGLTFIAASISGDKGDLLGGLVLGPMVMGDLQDTLYDLPEPKMAWEISKLSVLPTKKVQHLAELYASVVAHISGSEVQQMQNLMFDQEKMLKEIYAESVNGAADDRHIADKLIEFEKELRSTVISGEKAEALNMINDLLAQIYIYSNYDFKSVKVRLIELLFALSRATIEAGGDPGDTFRLNDAFYSEIESYTDVDQLAIWISDIVRRFVVRAFDLAPVKHSDVVFRITNYIKKNYADKLSLESLAKEVYLSKSYLSSVFKQETGLSLTSYITKVRVEKSKRMLREETTSLASIANLCGFKDQSYFTKVFKKETGLSPKRYRNGYYASSDR